MSKTLEEYGERKSCALTTARRLAQFLGDERIKDKGLACNYVVAKCASPPPPAPLIILRTLTVRMSCTPA
jgi:DNA polymerase epsilon subunit 1